MTVVMTHHFGSTANTCIQRIFHCLIFFSYRNNQCTLVPTDFQLYWKMNPKF